MRQRSTFDPSTPRCSLPQHPGPLQAPTTHTNRAYPWRDTNPCSERSVDADDGWSTEYTPYESGGRRRVPMLAEHPQSGRPVVTRPVETPKHPGPRYSTFSSLPTTLKLCLIGIGICVLLAAKLATA